MLLDKSAFCHRASGTASSAATLQPASVAPDLKGGLTAQQYLARLPRTVIRNGKVINIQEDVEALLGSRPVPRTVIQAPGISSAADSATMQMHGSLVEDATSLSPAATTRGGQPERRQQGLDSAIVSSVACADQQVQLRVKSDDGKRVYVLQLPAQVPISAVYSAVHQQRMRDLGIAAGSFELRSAFPARTFVDGPATLAALGLCPNATLLVRSTEPSV